MTLPDERRVNMKRINEFLNKWVWEMPELRRVSKKDKAKLVRHLGRHYPSDYQIDDMCDLFDEQEYLRSIPTCGECGSMMLKAFSGKPYCYICAVREYESNKKLSEVSGYQLSFRQTLYKLWRRFRETVAECFSRCA